MVNIDDQYRFAHDRIQEAAYNTIPAEKRCVIHFKYGIELSSLLIGEEDASASVLFTAVNQLNLGGPHAVQDKSQYVTAARLNLRAGKKAMEMSDYETAYSYFDCVATTSLRLRLQMTQWALITGSLYCQPVN